MNQASDGNDNLLLLEYGNGRRMEGTGLFLIWRQINEDSVVSFTYSRGIRLFLPSNLVSLLFCLTPIPLCCFIWQRGQTVLIDTLYIILKPN